MTEDELLNLLGQDEDIRAILEILRSLELKDSWLAAVSVRNFIWNILSGKAGFDADTDVDVVFFEPAVFYEETVRLEAKLKRDFSAYRWEMKNQVYMHIHSPNTQPYTSSRDAMSKYPERCTAIGLRLLANDELELFASFGLEDILRFEVRPTPHFWADEERKALYKQRIRQKNWQAKWSQLRLEFPAEKDRVPADFC